MILDLIEQALSTVDLNVTFGIADPKDIDAPWNYIVYFRTKLRPNENKNSLTDYFTVAVVRENYVPDDVAYDIIDAMLKIPGMRLASDDMEYDYLKKDDDIRIEVMTLSFCRAKKRCKNGLTFSNHHLEIREF